MAHTTTYTVETVHGQERSRFTNRAKALSYAFALVEEGNDSRVSYVDDRGHLRIIDFIERV